MFADVLVLKVIVARTEHPFFSKTHSVFLLFAFADPSPLRPV
jgi:hypothetical protein